MKHQEQNIYYVEDYLLISQSSMLKAKNFKRLCKLMTFWQVTSIKQNGLVLPTQDSISDIMILIKSWNLANSLDSSEIWLEKPGKFFDQSHKLWINCIWPWILTLLSSIMVNWIDLIFQTQQDHCSCSWLIWLMDTISD